MTNHEDLFAPELMFQEDAIADGDVEFTRFRFTQKSPDITIERDDGSPATVDEALALLRDALESGLIVTVRGAQ